MLQRKKGRMYGGHNEDATQISARMLPPVGVRMLEGAAFLPSLRCRLNSCKLLLGEFSFCWESVSIPTRLLRSEVSDGVSGNEAAEISSTRLLR